MRALTPDFLLALQGDRLSFFFLLRLGLDTPLCFTDADHEVYHGGEKYLPVGFKFDAIQGGAGLAVDTLTVNIDDTNQAIGAMLLSEDVRNKWGTLYLGIITEKKHQTPFFDFEDNTTGGWVKNGYGNAIIEVNNTNPISGHYDLKATLSVNIYSGFYTLLGFPVEAGRRYRVQFKYRHNSNTMIKHRVGGAPFFASATSAYPSNYEAMPATGGGIGVVDYEFTAVASHGVETAGLLVSLQFAPDKNEVVYIDDVQVTAITESGEPAIQTGRAFQRLFRGIVGGWELTGDNMAKIDLTNEMILWNKMPLRLQSTACPWSYRGKECNYKGQMGPCDKTYEACLLRNNQMQFGGDRFLTATMIKSVWWGRYQVWPVA